MISCSGVAKSWILSGLLGASLSVAQASVIRIDFGRGAIVGGEGDTITAPGWTPYRHNQASPANLLTTTGASSGYTLFHAGGSMNHLTETASLPSTPPAPANTYPDSSVYDAVYWDAARTFTLSGLDDSATYNLVFFGWANRSDSRATSVTINGVTQTYQPSNTSTGGQGGVTTFLDLVPVDGQIQFTMARGAGNSSNWILSAMEIHTIPEPGAALLMAFATVPVVLSRRRRVR